MFKNSVSIGLIAITPSTVTNKISSLLKTENIKSTNSIKTEKGRNKNNNRFYSIAFFHFDRFVGTFNFNISCFFFKGLVYFFVTD